MEYVCKSRRHSWSTEDSAERCCNGWTLVFKPKDDYETTGTLKLVLVPDWDLETIRKYARYTPLEESSSTPLANWGKLEQ